ncbi:MAG TPA: TetR/AcrR family transcriptional regulator [Magnetospirillaceae bacterium]|jgi:AcrR family transcriptional regulator
MSRSGDKRGTYHHGNLKEALIRAALDLIAERGPSGFTFAEASRAAGVSPAAPYRHFRGRDDLMADVAMRGFERFEAALLRGWNDGRPDRMTAFENMGKAYLGFARDEPAFYAAMFESGVAPEVDSALHLASERAFAVLRKATEELAATLPRAERPPALMMALHIFAMAHGIASLFARGDSARRKLPMAPEDLLEAAVLVYLRGLGLDRAAHT